MTRHLSEFSEARLKVQWAERHIYKLIDQYRNLLDADFAKVVVEDDFEPNQKRVKVVAQDDFPAFPLIIGDAVHNLRTAFDYIIVTITGEERLALPVGKSRKEAESSAYGKKIERDFPSLAKFIFDEIQPYHGGRFLLWELSELDSIDKHRLILPTISEAHKFGVELEDESGQRFSVRSFTTASKYASTRTIVTNGPLKIKHEGHSAISVRFGPGTPFDGKAVLETLGNLSELALKAVEAFERFHFRCA